LLNEILFFSAKLDNTDYARACLKSIG